MWREVRADDYEEPLAGMIRRGEVEPPDEFVMEDRPYPCEKCKGSGQWLDEFGFAWRCNKCDGTGKK